MPRRKAAVLDEPVREGRARSPAISTIEDIVDRKNSPIEQKKIAYELMALVGGEKGLARKIMVEYEATVPGSLARARFFELLLKLVHAVSPKELTGDLDYVSEEDIAGVLKEQLQQSGVKSNDYPTHFCI